MIREEFYYVCFNISFIIDILLEAIFFTFLQSSAPLAFFYNNEMQVQHEFIHW
jgi:hypothetical protein